MNCIGPTCLSLTEEEFSGRLEAVAPGTVANEKRKKRSVIDDNENGFSQIINIGLQIGFWLTPIFWSPSSMGDKIIIFFKLNPIYYITEGYRQTFISGIVFWDRGFINIYYWAFVVVVFVLGALIFHKLRPHFADIL